MTEWRLHFIVFVRATKSIKAVRHRRSLTTFDVHLVENVTLLFSDDIQYNPKSSHVHHICLLFLKSKKNFGNFLHDYIQGSFNVGSNQSASFAVGTERA